MSNTARCEQCGGALVADGGPCPSCGAVIRELDQIQATAPSARPAMTSRRFRTRGSAWGTSALVLVVLLVLGAIFILTRV